MATNPDFMEYVREQVGSAGEIAFRKMFGEYAVYLGGKVIALLCDNQFYLKPTAAGRALLGTVSEAPPFPGASLYFRLDAALDDPELMADALRTTAAALPMPRPKGARKAKTTDAVARRVSRSGSKGNSKVHSRAKAKAKAKAKGNTKVDSRAAAKSNSRSTQKR